MTASPKQEQAVSSLLIARWEEIHRKIATLAREFPEEKFESRPADPLRTFGEVLRHIAFWNQYVADVLGGKKADDSANELPLADYPTRAKIIKALEQTSHAVAVVLKERPALDAKTAEVVISFLEHSGEHYGQLAVYTRLAGITPPASRTGA